MILRKRTRRRPGKRRTRPTSLASLAASEWGYGGQCKGDLGVVIGEREGRGCWRDDDAEHLWHVGDLKPKILVVRRDIGLGQKLYGIDLGKCTFITCTVGRYYKRRSKRTFSRRIRGLIPADGGDGIWWMSGRTSNRGRGPRGCRP